MPALWRRFAGDDMLLIAAFLLVVAPSAHAFVASFARNQTANAGTIDTASLKRAAVCPVSAALAIAIGHALRTYRLTPNGRSDSVAGSRSRTAGPTLSGRRFAARRMQPPFDVRSSEPTCRRERASTRRPHALIPQRGGNVADGHASEARPACSFRRLADCIARRFPGS